MVVLATAERLLLTISPIMIVTSGSLSAMIAIAHSYKVSEYNFSLENSVF